MKIALFSMRGGATLYLVYERGSPIFDRITIQCDPEYHQGGEFIIETRNNLNRFIQFAKLSKPWFYHEQLIQGERLVSDIGSQLRKNRGSRATTK